MPTPQSSFHAFTTKYTGVSNRIITPVRLSAAFDPANPPSPPYPLRETQALWDTGATGSVVTKPTAEALGLVPVGRATVQHAGGSSLSNTYLVNFVLPNNVQVIGVLVSECEHIVGGGWGAIIGMDIITKGDFSITNLNNRTCVSYRIPSVETVDYVEEANKLNKSAFPKVGRNDPCPCGSGKKYKKCHGK